MTTEQKLLDEILRNYTPDYWSATSRNDFIGKRYIMRTIYSDNTQYDTAIKDMPDDYTIIQVDVIENPYILGRFVLQKEQLRKRGINPVVKQMYHPVLEDDLEEALEYNCDTRYYENACSIQSCNKKTRFYAKPELCSSIFYNTGKKVFIVLSVLTDAYSGNVVTTDSDTHYYPMFVVTAE